MLPEQEVAKKELLNKEIAKISKRGVGFYRVIAGMKATAIFVPRSGSSTGFSGTSVSFCSKCCLRELLWNAEPAVYLPETLAGIANLRPYFLSRSCRVASNFSGPITCT
jgi:hypothetical protein